MDYLAVAFVELDLTGKVEFVSDLCESYTEVIGQCAAGISAKFGSLKQISHLLRKKPLFRSTQTISQFTFFLLWLIQSAASHAQQASISALCQ